MSPEQLKERAISPFERVEKLLLKEFEPEVVENGNYLSSDLLNDKTKILIRRDSRCSIPGKFSINEPKRDLYRIRVSPVDGNGNIRQDRILEFTIGKESKDKELDIEKKWIDYLETIVNAQKYSEPPPLITASVSK